MAFNDLTELQRRLDDIATSHKLAIDNIVQPLTAALSPLAYSSVLINTQVDGMKYFISSFAETLERSIAFNGVNIIRSTMQNTLNEIIKRIDYSFVLNNITQSMSQISILLEDIYDVDRFTSVNDEPEQKMEFEDDIREIIEIEEKQNWQQKFYAKTLKWKNRNPLLAFILVGIILPLVISILYDSAKHLLVKPSQVQLRELPSVKSQVVVNIEHNEMITVIDSRPYWVNVLYLDPESCELHNGWLPKRACEPIGELPEEPKDSDTEEEVDEPTP